MAKKNNVPEGRVETPLMQQYYSIKATYPDALLLFRVGDFYETFGEDAVKTASILGIVLTRRANGAASFVELAGFPHHAIDTYLPKLVRAGNRVAICEQLEDPKQTKTLVKRGVTELISPGVAFSDKILENRENNFLGSVFFSESLVGVSFLDVSTGEFYSAEGGIAYIDKLIQQFRPSELLYAKAQKEEFFRLAGTRVYSHGLDAWVYAGTYAAETLQKQFGTLSLKGFGLESQGTAILAAGAAMHYVQQTRSGQLQHIRSISRLDQDKHVWLDRFTLRNLELLQAGSDGGRSVIDVMDQTITPMGARMLRRWLALPLKDLTLIRERHELVGFFLGHPDLQENLSGLLKGIGDLERLVSRLSVGRSGPRELLQLVESLKATEEICHHSEGIQENQLRRIADQLNPCLALRERLAASIKPDAPAALAKGEVISSGIDSELDDLRNIAHSGKDYLLRIQQKESQNTGITSLKIGYTSVFGYYLEVTNVHKEKVPGNWIRKQTLTNAERYITPELKEYEEKILGAEEKILQLETRLFQDLLLHASEFVPAILVNAEMLAMLDCLLSHASVAARNNYVCPVMNEGKSIRIVGGRHPVIERLLPIGEEYISNDVLLDPDHAQILMITGPNMSGKSALLRQTAIIQLLAQTGSFVPADSAELGIADKIFTRVGASDNLSSGESTFMVEMNETASILNNLSDRSLILLDEIGRGTSTYDGVSIAWAIAEFLHAHPGRPKTLFATHYHELNEMQGAFERIRNYHVSVKELDGKVLFLRKLQEGGSAHSFGIHVARLAGMPGSVVKRAAEVLSDLEKLRDSSHKTSSQKAEAKDLQLKFFQLDDPLLLELRETLSELNINTLTPVEALLKLEALKKMLGL